MRQNVCVALLLEASDFTLEPAMFLFGDVVRFGFRRHGRNLKRQREIDSIDHLDRLFGRKNITGQGSVHYTTLVDL